MTDTISQVPSDAAAVRGRVCPLCDTPPGRPCQPRPQGDHLARYLDAHTTGQLTKAYMAMVLAELVVIDRYAVVPAVEPGRYDDPAGGCLVSPADLRVVHAAVDYLLQFEGQDQGLVIEMSQAMLTDLIETDGLAPVADYVGRYGDVADNQSDVEHMAAEIEASLR